MFRLPKQAVIGSLFCLVVASTLGVASVMGIAGFDPPDPPQKPTAAPKARAEAPAPDLMAREGFRPTLDDAAGWINSDGPIHLDRLRGKIILLDFWTYCCINCHHILPDLARLEAKYRNELVVIGVHSAKFAAEKDPANIRAKVREYGIKHPVANDPEMVIWQRFGARSWPSLALIDASGRMVDLLHNPRGNGMLAGEGHFAALDAAIGQLVARARSRGELDETPVEFYSETDKPSPGALLYPGKIAADLAGKRLFISDTGHNRIVVTDLDGVLIATIGDGQAGLKDGDLAASRFHRPQGSCLVDDTLYVADTENHALRAVDLRAKTVRTVAGTGTQGQDDTGSGPGPSTAISSPWDVVALPGTPRSLAVAMAGTHQIWRYDLNRGTIAHWAGDGAENIRDGTAARARFAQPSGLATDGQHLFVADSEVSGLRAVALNNANHPVTTLVGLGLFRNGDVDGIGTAALLQHCLGVASSGGKLYVADSYNNKIKMYDLKTRAISTLVGTHERGAGDAPPQFDEPGGLAVAGGSLYVADTNNHAIRVVDLATRQVRTLDLGAIAPPAQKRTPRFLNAQTFEAPPVSTRAARTLDLEITLPLPPGSKLGADAPLVALVETDPAEAVAVEVRGVAREVENPTRTFRLVVPLSEIPSVGSTYPVKVSVSAFVCLPNTLCTLKSFIWTVPVTFGPIPARPVQLGPVAP